MIEEMEKSTKLCINPPKPVNINIVEISVLELKNNKTTRTSANAWISDKTTENAIHFLGFNSIDLEFFKYSAPIEAKIICDKARAKINGVVVIKKPIAVPIETNAATLGDINIAIITGTCEAIV